MRIAGKTKVFTILADPATHVTAPLIFNHIFESMGLDMVYIAHEVASEAVGATLQAYRSWKNLGGFNVTIPHKSTAAGHMDTTLPPADTLRVVNTVVRSSDGALTGYSTDGEGAIGALGGANGATCLMIGAGGAARAIVHSLITYGARHVFILNRTTDSARSLIGLFPPGKASLFDSQRIREIDLVVQATPVTDHVPFDLDVRAFGKGTRVLETVMRDTAFGREALRHGLELIPGHAMLFHQTYRNFELLTGLRAARETVKQAFEAVGYRLP